MMIFFQAVPMALIKLVPVSFPLVKASLKLLFWYSVNLWHCIKKIILVKKNTLSIILNSEWIYPILLHERNVI